ncbi:Uncharacterised protein [Yersinia enterocolitica]|nr:Uncharacterised protein [Yersinia enterocolitica]
MNNLGLERDLILEKKSAAGVRPKINTENSKD